MDPIEAEIIKEIRTPKEKGPDYDESLVASVSKRLGEVSTQMLDPWIKEYWSNLNKMAQECNGSWINHNTGELVIPQGTTASELVKLAHTFSSIYEAQERQNKEILMFIGKIIYEYAAVKDISWETACRDMGFLQRIIPGHRGLGLKTLIQLPRIIDKLEPEAIALPLNWTYLALAASFAEPEDPSMAAMFKAERAGILLEAVKEPKKFTRMILKDRIQEVQDKYNISLRRRTPVKELLYKIVALYRIQREKTDADLAPFNLTMGDISAKIYEVEHEMVARSFIPIDPLDDPPPVTPSKWKPNGTMMTRISNKYKERKSKLQEQ